MSKINTKETKPKQSLKPKLLKALNMNQFYVGPLILQGLITRKLEFEKGVKIPYRGQNLILTTNIF